MDSSGNNIIQLAKNRILEYSDQIDKQVKDDEVIVEKQGKLSKHYEENVKLFQEIEKEI